MTSEDLATIISRASLATLELADFDPALDALSRDALRGGANRFLPAMQAGAPVRYVAPVRVQDTEPSVGALVIQPASVGLVWRVGQDGPTHTWSAPLGEGTLVVSRPEWVPGGGSGTRFEITHDGRTCSFLLPNCRGPVHAVFTRLLGATDDATAARRPPVPGVASEPPAPVPPSAVRRPVGSPTTPTDAPRGAAAAQGPAAPVGPAVEPTIQAASQPADDLADPITATIPVAKPSAAPARTPEPARTPSVSGAGGVMTAAPPVAAPVPSRRTGALPGFLVGLFAVLAVGVLVYLFVL